jgi:hypothetical protein
VNYKRRVTDTVEAVQLPLDGTLNSEAAKFITMSGGHIVGRACGGMTVQTIEGTGWAWPGDWLVRGQFGYRAYAPDLFEATYEPA